MKVFAYCAQSLAHSVKRAAGVIPLTSPPLTMETFSPSLLDGHRLIYFKLHGRPRQPFWYGDKVTALSADQLRQANLQGSIVFAVNCHLPQSPMLQALFDGGAEAVIAGPGTNYAWSYSVDGADLLGMTVRRLLSTGLSPRLAFETARVQLQASLAWTTARLESRRRRPHARTEFLRDRERALRDTMDFRLVHNPRSQK